eukprot:TRINITY_DN316_c0_g1_i11.p1 TRINITY_DN316_c0_g1~~TRINITY_DN316_c0_g1_i11.p1  ORF type:complete len:350 (-),score=58.76 TRINITY_DN316_c0_g1_i11:718-1767(-)
MCEVYDVIIIGAGMAGITAAKQLKDRGFKVVVLEARPRTGGRIWTEKFADNKVVDLGAEWTHTFWSNPLTEIARQHDIGLFPSNYESVALFYNGQRVDNTSVKSGLVDFNHAMSICLDSSHILKKEELDITLEEAFKRAVDAISKGKDMNPEKRRITEFFIFHSIVDNWCTELSNISYRGWVDEDTDFNHDGGDCIVSNGYSQFLDILSHNLKKEIRLNHPISTIKYEEGRVEVLTSKGRFLGSKAVITLPIGVLKSETVEFLPPLPAEKMMAIKEIPIGLLNKIVVCFEKPFWPTDIDFLGYIPQDDGSEVYHNNNNKKLLLTLVLVCKIVLESSLRLPWSISRIRAR